jgi:hypothetical protein
MKNSCSKRSNGKYLGDRKGTSILSSSTLRVTGGDLNVIEQSSMIAIQSLISVEGGVRLMSRSFIVKSNH